MADNLIYKKTILINANLEKVWNVLTKPEFTKQYMFNNEVFSNWKIGSEIIWKGNYKGYESFQKGFILDLIPLKLIKYSTFDPNFGFEDKEENYIYVSYILSPKNNSTEITFISENFGKDKKRYEHNSNGWDNIIIPTFIKVFENFSL